jgi:PAS domain S-box-containing protein
MNKITQILLIEDNRADASLIGEMLAEAGGAAFALECVGRLSSGLERLDSSDIDLILLDLSLPDSYGLNTFAKAHTHAPQVPIIVLSGLDDEALAIQAVRDGAQDYLVKGRVSGHLLTRAIRYAIERARAARERARAEQVLRESEERLRTVSDFTHDWEYWVGPDGRYLHISPSCERITGYEPDAFIRDAELLQKIVHPDDREIFDRHPHDRPSELRASREAAEISFRIITKDNEERWIGHVCQPVYSADGDWRGWRASNRDITPRIAAEREIRQRNHELTVLNQIGQVITSTLDLQEALALITDHTTRLMDLAATSVLLYDEAGDDLYFAAASTSNAGAASMVGKRLAMNQGIAGWVIQHGEPALAPDVSQDPCWYTGFGDCSMMCIPLLSHGHPVGVLEALKQEDFSQNDLHLLNALAAPVATAIKNAQLFEQVSAGRQQLEALSHQMVEVQEAERAHIARELHDETGQALSSMLLELKLLEQEVSHSEAALARIAGMETAAEEMLENLHRLSMNLHPATLDHLGLVAALEQQVEAFTTQHDIDARFEAVGFDGVRLPPEIEVALYRISQEALTNVVRHAQAGSVDILLEKRGGRVVTVVEDNGVGFDPKAAMQGNRLGLFGMQERVKMLGGTMEIESASHKGTTVHVEIPDTGSPPD